MRTSSTAAHLGKWQRRPHRWQQCHEKQIGCGLRTLWALFFPGRGVKSRLQYWGVCVCVCAPGPQGNYKKIWGTFRRSDTVALCLFFLSHYIFNYQVRREAHYLGEPDPMLLFFLTTKLDKGHLWSFGSPNADSQLWGVIILKWNRDVPYIPFSAELTTDRFYFFLN